MGMDQAYLTTFLGIPENQPSICNSNKINDLATNHTFSTFKYSA